MYQGSPKHCNRLQFALRAVPHLAQLLAVLRWVPLLTATCELRGKQAIDQDSPKLWIEHLHAVAPGLAPCCPERGLKQQPVPTSSQGEDAVSQPQLVKTTAQI
jgi:hypothetical protein